MDIDEIKLKGTLAKALAKAQGEFDTIRKEQDNPFFKSKYADLSAILNVVRPVLASNGLAIIQFPRTDYTESGCMVHVETNIMHESGACLMGTLSVKPTKTDPQGVGSAITYARRYALQSVLLISAEDDDDGNAASQGNQQTQPAPAPAPPQYDGPTLEKVKGDIAALTEPGKVRDYGNSWYKRFGSALPGYGMKDYMDTITARVDELQAAADRVEHATALKALHAAYREAYPSTGDKEADRTNRHAWASTELDKEVKSFSDLPIEDIKRLDRETRAKLKAMEPKEGE